MGSINDIFRRHYFCGLKGRGKVKNKIVICDLATSLKGTDADFKIWAHAGYPDEMTDIAGDLDLNTRAQMKRDCFNKMMSESLWPVEDEEFDEDGDDTLA